jgi:hypothetical protein
MRTASRECRLCQTDSPKKLLENNFTYLKGINDDSSLERCVELCKAENHLFIARLLLHVKTLLLVLVLLRVRVRETYFIIGLLVTMDKSDSFEPVKGSKNV